MRCHALPSRDGDTLVQDVPRLGCHASRRVAQHQTEYSFGMGEGEPLPDHAAHGKTHEMGALHADTVHEGADVVHHLHEPVGPVGHLAPTVTAGIVAEHAITTLQGRRLGRPHGQIGRERMAQGHRRRIRGTGELVFDGEAVRDDSHPDEILPLLRSATMPAPARTRTWEGPSVLATETAELVPVLQTAIGPVVMISGVGLLLLTMTNRLARVVDRSRMLARQVRETRDEAKEPIRAQLRILKHRAGLIRRAIALATFCVLFAAILIIALFCHRAVQRGHPLAGRSALHSQHGQSHRLDRVLHPGRQLLARGHQARSGRRLGGLIGWYRPAD